MRQPLHSATRVALGQLLLLVSNAVIPGSGPASVLTGSLRNIGSYPSPATAGPSFVVLDDDSVFVYGAPMSFGASREPASTPSQRHNAFRVARASRYNGSTLLWKPSLHAWKKLEAAPECPKNSRLHTATLLPDARILIAGGLCEKPDTDIDKPPQPRTRTSIWNSRTEKWEPAPSLAVARVFHTASLLQDGSVLVTGGARPEAMTLQAEGEPVLDSVERYRDGKLTVDAPLNVARASHTATTLPDGSVLVAGGLDAGGTAIASVEIRAPRSGTWRIAPAMKTARFNHSATLLADGRLMVAGGLNEAGMPVASVETWDPAAGQWTEGPPLLTPVQGHSAVLLTSGNVLLVGGRTLEFKPMQRPMLWQRELGQWLPADGNDHPSMADDYWAQAPALAARADGSAFLFGESSIAHWVPNTEGSWASMPHGPRERFNAAAMGDGRVLVTGGHSGAVYHDWAEIFDPGTGRFTVTGRLNQAQHSHTAIRLDDGRMVVAGGWTHLPGRPDQPGGHSPEVWDPASGRWSLLDEVRFEWQDKVSFSQLNDGRVLFFASRERVQGARTQQVEYRAWRWDPRSGAVEALQVPVKPRSDAAIAILADGRVMVAGGNSWIHDPGQPCVPTAVVVPGVEQSDDAEWECLAADWKAQHEPGMQAWDSRSGSVQALEGPPDWHPDNPATLALRNGNVLVANVPAQTAKGAERQPDPMRMWEAATARWRTLPALPKPQPWPVLELEDGTLATNAYRLLAGAGEWEPRAQPPLDDPRLVQLPSGTLLSLSATRPFIARFDDGAGQWRLRPPGETPAWSAYPTLVALADGRLLAIGMVENGPEAVHSSYLWNPKDGQWQEAGRLPRAYGEVSAATQMPSGRVLHAGVNRQQQLTCEILDLAARRWTDCGAVRFGAENNKPENIKNVFFGTLADGRVAMMTTSDEVYVFDDRADKWTSMKVNWSGDIDEGAPVRQDSPLASAYDAAKRQWIDISAVAGQYWESDRYARSALWDSRAGQWTYLFKNAGEEQMGSAAMVLPDGCALALWPPRIFNPASGKTTTHADPKPWLRGWKGERAVLAGGNFVAAGTTWLGGPTFFHRKVSCAGFAASAYDSVLMPGETVVDESHSGPGAAAAKKLAPLLELLWRYRWIALALIFPVVLYFLLTPPIMPRARD